MRGENVNTPYPSYGKPQLAWKSAISDLPLYSFSILFLLGTKYENIFSLSIPKIATVTKPCQVKYFNCASLKTQD